MYPIKPIDGPRWSHSARIPRAVCLLMLRGWQNWASLPTHKDGSSGPSLHYNILRRTEGRKRLNRFRRRVGVVTIERDREDEGRVTTVFTVLSRGPIRVRAG